jgi:hypothetical protein
LADEVNAKPGKGAKAMTMLKCLICDLQPRSEGSLYCHNCGGKLKAGRSRKSGGVPSTFLVYNDNVVGLIPNGCKDAEGCELFTPVLLKRNPEGLPKGSKTLNLNTHCEGYTRQQIKRLKAAVKQATG